MTSERIILAKLAGMVHGRPHSRIEYTDDEEGRVDFDAARRAQAERAVEAAKVILEEVRK